MFTIEIEDSLVLITTFDFLNIILGTGYKVQGTEFRHKFNGQNT